jgi:hypothetical protein
MILTGPLGRTVSRSTFWDLPSVSKISSVYVSSCSNTAPIILRDSPYWISRENLWKLVSPIQSLQPNVNLKISLPSWGFLTDTIISCSDLRNQAALLSESINKKISDLRRKQMSEILAFSKLQRRKRQKDNDGGQTT